MSTAYRLVVHCDATRGGACLGVVSYDATSRLALAEASDRHQTASGWLRGYRAGATYDVCPACRPLVERESGDQGDQGNPELEATP
jgi:hypothetical protein